MKRFPLFIGLLFAIFLLAACAVNKATKEPFKYDRARIGTIRRVAVMGFVGEVKRDKSRIALRQIFQEKLAEFRRFYIIPDDSVRQVVIDYGVRELPQGYNVNELRRVARKLRADGVIYGENFSTQATEGQGKYLLGGKDLLPHFHAILVTPQGQIIWKAWAEGEAGKETQLKKTLTLGLIGEEEQVLEAVGNAMTALADYLVRGELPSAIDTHPHIQ
ncbi:MAG: hypothetical protein ONB44_21190 [candidate division KSB1 bacterium]|nr:hypothetical protein [candidate division KSB1 bacterium]